MVGVAVAVSFRFDYLHGIECLGYKAGGIGACSFVDRSRLLFGRK